jgi:hypothetical protein
MSDAPGEEKPVIHSDEDWKQRVKAEDAALDEKFRAEAATKDAPAAETASKPATEKTEATAKAEEPADFPPASLYSLISMFSTQAMVGLGVIPNPVSGKAEANLPLARHFIDTLGVLEEKTDGNLDPGEHKFLEQTLHQLRMAYVELSKSPSAEKK